MAKKFVEQEVTDDLEALMAAMPPHVYEALRRIDNREDLLEVILDLGRRPEARFPDHEIILSEREVVQEDINHVINRIGSFGDDNRAGIERTLHRISAIRNRKGKIVGLTCRVGRAVFGTIGIIRDIVESGQSIMLLGRPGVGKTTMLREVARVLADDFNKRVVIVDTSNEIGGDGDIPHPAIGQARRMQVPTPTAQHAVMIEAVENHMPEVIIIDEIGTELEAVAARTIAERGVQLIGTAHGNTLENLMMNPTLSDLIGGIQTVTLGDEEARRRGTQKSVLERKAPPTFNVVVEIQDWSRVAVHHNVAETVDSILRGQPILAEVRFRDESGEIKITEAQPHEVTREAGYVLKLPSFAGAQKLRVYPYGVSHNRLDQAIKELQLPVVTVRDLEGTDLVITLKNYYRRKPTAIREAEANGVPVYILKNNSILQIESCLARVFNLEADPREAALQETKEAIGLGLNGAEGVDLSPQSAFIRRLQHEMAERNNLSSYSRGREPHRRVRIVRTEA